MRDRTQGEGASDTLIKVPHTLKGAHDLVLQAQRELESAVLHPNKTIIPPVDAALHLSVSKDALTRALRIMDALLKHLATLNYEVSSGASVVVEDVKIRFGMSEEVRMPPISQQKRDPRTLRFHARPIGLLNLHILTKKPRSWKHITQWIWKESKTKPLEGKLASFVNGLILFATQSHEYLDVQKKMGDDFAEEVKQWEAGEAKRVDLNKTITLETSRFDKLIANATNWESSRLLRGFIAAAEADYRLKHGNFLPGSVLAEWIAWATSHADRLDPFIAKASFVLDEKLVEEQPRKPFYWGDRDPHGYFK